MKLVAPILPALSALPLAESVSGKVAPWMLAWAARQGRELGSSAIGSLRRRISGEEAPRRHLLVAICDHYEPFWTGDPNAQGAAPDAAARERVRAWREGYPALASRFRDADGRPPRHSFFYPGEQYAPDLLEPIAELCAGGFGECEVHLHHDKDNRASLKASLEEALRNFGAHGLVPETRGKPRWSFIHGNWCLANSRRDGAYCGVDDELELLHELGCYADFTFPSAPDETQPAIVNSIYYPSGDVRQRRAHEAGEPAKVGTPRSDKVLLIQGPLALAPREAGRPGTPVRIDAAALTANDPPTLARLRTWIQQNVHVEGRPEWVFIKLHTHGAPEPQAAALLGEPLARFHEALASLGTSGRFAVHYVTAREMYNIARAAMDGLSGWPTEFRDYEIAPPPRALS